MKCLGTEGVGGFLGQEDTGCAVVHGEGKDKEESYKWFFSSCL